MIKSVKEHIFNFFSSPYAFISALPLIIISSSRLAYGIIAFFALLWVCLVSTMIKNLTKNFFPGLFNNILLISLCSAAGGIFLLIFSFVNPLLAKETILISLLTPVYCFTSESAARAESAEWNQALLESAVDALLPGIFIIILSALREILGFGTLSLPGGAGAIQEIFKLDVLPYPLKIISTSGGAFMLLGYIFIIFRLVKSYSKKAARSGEDDE